MDKDFRSNPGAETEEDTLHGKYLTFTIGKEIYGLEVRHVTEIIGIQPITEVPEVPAFVRGIINLRGRIVPVVDIRLKFGKEPVPYDDRTCIVIVEMESLVIGMIVDNVADVLTIPDENIVTPPDTKVGFNSHFIKGIGKVASEIILILDCGKIVSSDDLENISAN